MQRTVGSINETNSHLAKRQQGPVNIQVPTYIHIVSSTNKQNDIAEAVLFRQLAALNEGFNTTGFQFNLAGSTRTVNDTWAFGRTVEIQQEMKGTLRKGGYDTLNLYFLSDWSPSYRDGLTYGECFYPVPSPTPDVFARDGCIIQQLAMPGSLTNPDADLDT